MADYEPGVTVKIELFRDGKTLTVSAVLGEFPEAGSIARGEPKSLAMLRLLLALAGRLPGLRASPSRVEQLLVHLLYLAGLALLAWPAAVVVGRSEAIGFDTLLAVPLTLAALSTLLLVWSVRARSIPPEDGSSRT